MKKYLLSILVLGLRILSAQTAIPATTTIVQLKTLAPGKYYFVVGTDTSFYTACTPFVTLIHDTIPRICPPVVIPTPIKQRTMNALNWDAVNKRWVVGYDNGTFSTF